MPIEKQTRTKDGRMAGIYHHCICGGVLVDRIPGTEGEYTVLRRVCDVCSNIVTIRRNW